MQIKTIVICIGLVGCKEQPEPPMVEILPPTAEKTQLGCTITDIVVRPRYEIVKMNVSAYCPCKQCCGDWADGITASGHVIRPDDKFVAAPKTYAFGVFMLIEGYSLNPVPVLDRGGAIKGNKLDLFFPDHQAAKNWGRKQIEVKILK